MDVLSESLIDSELAGLFIEEKTDFLGKSYTIGKTTFKKTRFILGEINIARPGMIFRKMEKFDATGGCLV